MMSLEEEIQIIRFSQGVDPDSFLLDRFRQLDTDEKKNRLMKLTFLEWELKTVDSDIEQAIADSALKDTDLPVVQLRRDRIKTNRTALLPESELEKAYLLYLYLFKTAYRRYFKREKSNLTDWWLQDLSNDETVQELVTGYKKLIDEIYTDTGFRGEFASLAKNWYEHFKSAEENVEEPVFDSHTKFHFLTYDEMVTEYAKQFDHRNSGGIALLRRSLNNALSIRYRLEPERVWRILSDVVDRHLEYLKLLHRAYEAFNKRDIDAVLVLMHPDVDWPNGWEGGYVHGHDEVRDYWTRQWQQLDPRVTPVSFHLRPNGNIEVDVRQFVKDMEGQVLADGQVKHVYSLIDGKIKKMAIE